MRMSNIHLNHEDATRFLNNLMHPDREAIRRGKEFADSLNMKLVRQDGDTYEYEVPDIDLGDSSVKEEIVSAVKVVSSANHYNSIVDYTQFHSTKVDSFPLDTFSYGNKVFNEENGRIVA